MYWEDNSRNLVLDATMNVCLFYVLYKPISFVYVPYNVLTCTSVCSFSLVALVIVFCAYVAHFFNVIVQEPVMLCVCECMF